ncbi:MAG: thiamine phosphate synthase [Myxococcota bacterium]
MKSAALARLRGIYPLADDDPRWRNDPKAVIEGALAGGASAVQLRLKHTADGDALTLARWAAERARAAGALFVVNDRFDLADLAGADGVHLGQRDLPPERIPDELRARLLIGLSTHTLAQVRESRARPVDYIGFGPVFGTKSLESAWGSRGTAMLAEAVGLAERPVVAIGGIDLANAAEITRAGAAAAAVISAIADAPDPAAATRALAGELA